MKYLSVGAVAPSCGVLTVAPYCGVLTVAPSLCCAE